MVEPTETIKNQIQLGEVVLVSNQLAINELAGLAVALLKDKHVKGYLYNLERKKLMKGVG